MTPKFKVTEGYALMLARAYFILIAARGGGLQEGYSMSLNTGRESISLVEITISVEALCKARSECK